MNVFAIILLIFLSPFLLFAAIIAVALLIYLICFIFAAILSPFEAIADGIRNIVKRHKKK